MARKLRPYLEYQADRVEAVLAAHRAPGRITGGTVGPRLVRFFLDLDPHTRFTAIKRLADDLALAMRVSNLSIDRNADGVVLSFANPDPKPVDLLPLLDGLLPIPPATALLGLTDSGVPLLARLAAPEVAHVLVAGTTGSGKSVLLRTMATSLLLPNPPDALRLLCIDPKGRTFAPLAGAAHLARPVITAPPEAHEALHSLLRTMEIRDRRHESPGTSTTPRIVVFVELILEGRRVVGKGSTAALAGAAASQERQFQAREFQLNSPRAC